MDEAMDLTMDIQIITRHQIENNDQAVLVVEAMGMAMDLIQIETMAHEGNER